MPFYCGLSVAGLRIRIETELPLPRNREFLPFLTEEPGQDILGIFRQVSDLPPVPDCVLHTGLCHCVTRTPEGQSMTYFREAPDSKVFYACAVASPAGDVIYVDYLPDYRHCVSEVRNCFYHLGLESILLRRDRLCLHASCVDTHLGGLLFSGVSGIGKSTQAELWCRFRGARQINGDRPILSREGSGWLAWGSPYAGSSRCHVNDKCPVTAVLLLGQGNDCVLRRLTPAQAFRGIWEGLTIHSYDPAFVEKASALAVELACAVPVFRYDCTPDARAVDYLEKTLGKELSL